MMKLFVLSLLSLSVTLAAAFDFRFDVSISGPENSGCDEADLKKFFKGLKRKFELRGNDYLQDRGFPGIFVDIDIVPEFRRELSMEDLEELENLTDEELEQTVQDRELQYNPWWNGVGEGRCRSCPPDPERRKLRALSENDVMEASDFESWMNGKMPIFMERIVTARGNTAKCKASASEWTALFVWGGKVV